MKQVSHVCDTCVQFKLWVICIMDTGSQTLAALDFRHLSPKKNEFVPYFIPSGRKFLRAQIFVIFVYYKVITIFLMEI